MKEQQEEPLIRLVGVSKSFGNNVILNNVDLDIYRGDALVIIGPSGTGKSTILRIIAGLMPSDKGSVYIKGQRRKGLIEDGKDPLGISMVFQQAALFDSLTVAENVGFSLYQHSHLSREEIRELVKEKLDAIHFHALIFFLLFSFRNNFENFELGVHKRCKEETIFHI